MSTYCARIGFVLFAAALEQTAAAAVPATCMPCHQKQVNAHAGTKMSRALERPQDSAVLAPGPPIIGRNGPYTYLISRRGADSVYSVSDGLATLSETIRWVFGGGAAGQTYIFERNGRMYESRMSYYRAIDALDLTTGALNREPRTLEEAAGRLMDAGDVKDCFGCHSGGGATAAGFDFDRMTPGVQCVSCHTDAEAHAASMSTRQPVIPKRLTTLSTEEVSELCGSCHRTWGYVASNGPQGIMNIRFQPYRLANSRCYDAEDRRIACVACHDPHQNPDREATAYDSRCLVCHSPQAQITRPVRVCKTGKSRCVECHMPKLEAPGTHFRFTDHQVRIVRPNEPYPN